MAFAIVSSCLLLNQFINSISSLEYYSCYEYSHCSTNSTGVAIYSCLLPVSLIGMSTNLIVAYALWKLQCPECCSRETRGVRLFLHMVRSLL